jgi:predicted RNase H-like HicB family nuclease
MFQVGAGMACLENRSMTQERDFKRLVRERMAKTGESYSAARTNILKTDADTTELMSEARRLGIAARQLDGSWVAQVEQAPEFFAKGATKSEAIKQVIEAVWEAESAWDSQIDPETAHYLSLTDD